MLKVQQTLMLNLLNRVCPVHETVSIVFSSGNWMYIVNMPDDVQYQQFVRSEVCM